MRSVPPGSEVKQVTMDSLTQFVTEMWSLFGVAVAFTLFRGFARIKSVGLKGLQPDDHLAFVALIGFAGEVVIAYSGGSIYYKEKATGALPEQMGRQPPDSSALEIRTRGSKLHFASWIVYSTTLWVLKASLLVLYLRLTTGLAGRYRCRILFGFGFVVVSWTAVILTTFLACLPFHKYFSTDPVVTEVCKPAVSPPIVWTCYSLNVATDLYLISIPLPMPWKISMRTWKKIGLGILFSAGAVVVVFATIRCVLITMDPKNGAPVSGTWAVRETFVAIITTNFPMAFTLARGMLSPAFKPLRTSSHTEGQQQQKQSEGLQTFGSSGGNMKARGGGNPTFTNMLCSESEERMVNGESPLAEELPSWSSPTLQSDSVYGSKSGPEK